MRQCGDGPCGLSVLLSLSVCLTVRIADLATALQRVVMRVKHEYATRVKQKALLDYAIPWKMQMMQRVFCRQTLEMCRKLQGRFMGFENALIEL